MVVFCHVNNRKKNLYDIWVRRGISSSRARGSRATFARRKTEIPAEAELLDEALFLHPVRLLLP
jgi:hypothetical protein